MKVARNRRVEFLVVAMLAAACGQAGSATQATAALQSAVSPLQVGGQAAREPVTLEFDLPAEFRGEQPGRASIVTGFRVGFFRENDAEAINVVDFSRDALIVQGGSARVTVAREQLPPECASDCTIRVQTLASGQSSAWSDPVPLLGQIASGASAQSTSQRPRQSREIGRERAPRSGSPRQRIRGGLTLSDIQSYPPLNEALRSALPATASLEAELQRFRRVEEVALVLVLSRDNDVAFTVLSDAIAGPPRVPPREALAKLRPDLDAPSAIRRARADARRLTATPNPNGRQ